MKSVKGTPYVLGDVFISRYYDDDDNFIRMNFKLNELSSQSKFIKQAIHRNELIGLKPETCKAKNCQKKGTSRCGRCKNVWYCSRQCQLSHWKKHKKKCKQSGTSDSKSTKS